MITVIAPAFSFLPESEKALVETSILTPYDELPDGTWECDGYIYRCRLEISGRMPNAAADTTFIYLTNIGDITFDEAWRAAGFSSSLEDYFSKEEAVLVEMTTTK